VRYQISAIHVVDRAIAPLSGSPGSLERSTQTLPVPLGGLAPVHRTSKSWRHGWSRHRGASLTALALAAAGCGVWLSVSPRYFEAGRDGAGVHVGGTLLARLAQPSAGTEVFTGQATLVIVTPSPKTMTASAVMTWNGMPTIGRCVLIAGGTGSSERCDYTTSATRLTSIDTFDPRTRVWHRRYDDGVEILITVPTRCAVIPIPFPLGH
jgi:hypothetical protein